MNSAEEKGQFNEGRKQRRGLISREGDQNIKETVVHLTV